MRQNRKTRLGRRSLTGEVEVVEEGRGVVGAGVVVVVVVASEVEEGGVEDEVSKADDLSWDTTPG